jgi:alpha-methylacyl-CoA racemase
VSNQKPSATPGGQPGTGGADGRPSGPDDPGSPDQPDATGGPLQGITVLDLSSVGPSARCTRLLADYGARVVKVAPVPSSEAEPIQPPFFTYSGHRGMGRVLVDLKNPSGREAFLALTAQADVVIESFRPGVVERLGIGYEAVRRRNPRIVYCSTSGYGQHGPRAQAAGHDIDYLAVGGYLAMSTPGTGGAPPLPGATIADAAAGGMHAALAITAALAGRAASGEGAYLDVSVADGVLWLMSLPVDEQLALGDEPAPGHDILSGRFACYGVYETRDGKWLAVGAIEPKFFANLCRALGCADLIPLHMDDSADTQSAIRSAFSAAFATRDRDEWVATLADADTCVAPVLSVAEVARDAGFAARGVLVSAHHPSHGTFCQLAPLLAGMARPATQPIELPDPAQTDTTDLLEKAGVDGETIALWLAEKVVA